MLKSWMPPSWLAGWLSGTVTCSRPAVVIYLLDTNAIGALMRADIRMAPWLSSVGTLRIVCSLEARWLAR
jgi:hypothetical protein